MSKTREMKAYQCYRAEISFVLVMLIMNFCHGDSDKVWRCVAMVLDEAEMMATARADLQILVVRYVWCGDTAVC